MILCIGTTPAAQRVMLFPQLLLDRVNRATDTMDGPAGKSINVAKVLKTLGAAPVATGFFGGPRGLQMEAWMRAREVPLDFVTVETPTRECITVIDQTAETITELVEESRPVRPTDYEKLLAIMERRIPECTAVVMSGTIAAGGSADLYFRGTALAREAGVLSTVDASGPALLEALRARPGLVKPNRAEIEATLGRKLPDRAALLLAVRELHSLGAQRVVVTAGAEPSLAFDGERFWNVRSPKIRPVNPIGSGDAFTAALVWRLVQGDDLGEACRWGAAAGAANALTPMPGDLRRADVDRLVSEVIIEPTGDAPLPKAASSST